MRKVKSQFRLAACAVISFLTALSPLQQLTVGVNAEGDPGTDVPPADTTPVLYSYENVNADQNSLNGLNVVIARVQHKNTNQSMEERTALVGQQYTQDSENRLKGYDFTAVNARLASGQPQQQIIEFDDQTVANDSIWKFEKATDGGDNCYYIELLDGNLASRNPAQYLSVKKNDNDPNNKQGVLSIQTAKTQLYVSKTSEGKYILSNSNQSSANNTVFLSMDSDETKDGFHAYNVQNEDRKKLTLYQIKDKVNAPALSTVDTLDTSSTGITTTMYDYAGTCDGKPDGTWGQQKSSEQNLYIKNNNKGESNHYSTNIVQKKLDGNGLPVISENFRPDGANGNTDGLFGKNKGITTGNSLFSKKIYDDTGWFEYDSNNNYAYLDQKQKNFIVYNQIGTPIYQSAFENQNPDAYKRGNFMPYNQIVAGKYSDFTNDLDSASQALEQGSAREHEVLYKTQKTRVQNGLNSQSYVYGNDYYFGMQMEVPSFYQPKDGKVYKKVNGVEQNDTEDMEYKFCGDDDLWVFIDNVLVLDIGGIHGAINGSINFASGAVTVGPGDFDGSTSSHDSTTIYDRFRQAGYTDQQLNDLFRDSTYDGKAVKVFKDYSMHSLKMFYMERGAGASDLDMRFNLQLPTKFTVKNTMVSNPDYSTYEKKDYRFQAMKKNPDGIFTPITSDYTKAVYVDDNGNETPVTFAEDGTFSLKLNQKVKFVLPDISDEYYVQEVGVDPDLIRRVRLKVNSAPDTELPGNNGTFSGASRKVADAETGDDLVFINEPVYRLKVVKEDGNASGKKLAGAVFNLGTQNGRVISGNLKTSDDKGVATENKDRNSDAMRLTDGTYTLNETTAPDGYALMQGNLNLVIQDVPEKENAVKVSSDGKVPYGSLSYEKDSDDFTVYTITVRNYPDGVTPSRPLPPGNSSDQPGRKSLRHGKTSVSGNATGKQKKGSAESKAAPDTADHTGIMRWTGLLIGAIAVIGCVLGFRKKYSN